LSNHGSFHRSQKLCSGLGKARPDYAAVEWTYTLVWWLLNLSVHAH
jgi:hypothetical protein